MIKVKRKNGYLKEVINTNGTKVKVAITQPIKAPKGKPWKASTFSPPYRTIVYGRSAEGLAKRLALMGHKSVVILN